jgi:hypothetical protein
LGQGGEHLAKDVVDVGGGWETSGEGCGYFCAKLTGFHELLVGASVEETE